MDNHQSKSSDPEEPAFSPALFGKMLVQERTQPMISRGLPTSAATKLVKPGFPLGLPIQCSAYQAVGYTVSTTPATTYGIKLKHRPAAMDEEHAQMNDMGINTSALKIGIIGAGMAGLYAAIILDSLGLTNYEILEANPERVGGRVLTEYFDPAVPPDKYNGFPPQEKWSYIDYGAMRFPCIGIMDRVIGSEPWSLTNYLNSHTEGDALKINLLDYHLSVDNNIQYYNSIRKTNAEVESDPKDPLHFGKSNKGGVDDTYVQESYKKWLHPAFDHFKKLLNINIQGSNTGVKELMKYDHFSVRAYLRTCGPDKAKYPEELIDYLEMLDSSTGHYDKALTEAVFLSFNFDSPGKDHVGEGGGSPKPVPWKCVEGGMGRFPKAMQSVIKSKPEKGKRVSKIAPTPPLAGRRGRIDVFVAGEENPRKYDHVINTMPPAVLRSLDTAECNFSYAKRTALRVLGVDPSLKIGLLFKSRWWQDETVMKGKPIKGGQSSTDLPIRTIVYPSYGIDDADAPGVLIASYLRGQDAARISALAAAELVELALSNIAVVHDVTLKFVREQYTQQYRIQDWNREVYSQGAFARFGPGQFTTVYPGLVATEMEGCYHTAGEMASVDHGWIVGALNSAWRCVFEILCAESRPNKIRELINKWECVKEVDDRFYALN